MPALIYPAGLLLALHLGGAGCWLLVPFNLLLVPLADQLLDAVRWQPSPRLLRSCFAPWVYWIYAAAQLGALLAALHAICLRNLSLLEWMGLVSSTGLMTGTAGITAAHELIHRTSPAQRGLGLALLAMTSYMHFRIEHVYGHHRFAGTARDAASARLGQSFPGFFLRALLHGGRDAWRIERARLARAGRSAWSPRNRLLHYLLLQGAVYAAAAWFGGWMAPLFLLLQSLMAVHLLEAVNYVQHYGLRREAGAGGEPRRMRAADSWDSTSPLAPLLSFNIVRHAQHHLSVRERAHQLPVLAGSPKLPASFFAMVFCALIPPLWHRLMDPRAQAPERYTHTDPRPLTS
ncbi:MAG TPA: alkane 1-monooxygenase [Nevskiaceae bacterium]|nr:alkane 1-monooxygenase [Nevskiaceae bacterium]